jgi:tRNA threonylcarbamoyladenosine biosynthesis protein TsaE
MTLEIHSKKPEDTLAFGKALGETLKGGEVIELIGDLGAGKTQLVRGIAEGINSDDVVQSPSFTISRIYKGSGLELHHYDFYRLGDDPGILRAELAESLEDPHIAVVTEWANAVEDVLPSDKLTITISYQDEENARLLSLKASGEKSASIIERLS